MLALLLALIFGTSIFWSSTAGKKLVLATSLAIMGVYVSFVLQKDIKHLFLIFAIFLIPLRIDFYIGFKKTFFIQTGYPGLPITAFDIMMAMLCGHFLLQVIRGEQKLELFPAISVPAVIYILLSGISAGLSYDKALSFSNFILIIKSYVVFLYFANRIKNKDDLSLVAFALFVALSMQSAVGILQYITGGSFLKGVFGVPNAAFIERAAGSFSVSRVGGTIGHPNALGRYICFCITILLGYSFARINKYLSGISAVTVVVGGFVLLLTMSRGSWMALGLTFIFLFYHIFRHFFKSRLKAMITVLLLNIFLASFILLVSENVRTRLFKDDYGSAWSRMPMAQVGLNIIRHHPLTGIGLNNYTHVMNLYDRTRNWQTYKFRHPVHNSYILIAAESGIPALAAFLWMLAAFFMKTRSAFKRIEQPLSLFVIGCIGGVMTWMLSGLFDRDPAGLNVMLWFTIALALASNQIMKNKNQTERAE